MEKFLLRVFTFVAALILVVTLSHAQSAETGSIIGTVNDTEGLALPGVSVTVSSPNLIGGPQVTLTNTSGNYRFVGLPPGAYAIDVALQGFKPARREGIRLSVAMTLSVNFILKIGTLSEEVTVIGEAPLIDMKNSSTAETVLDETFLENIPTAFNANAIINLAPGVTQAGSAFGGDLTTGLQVQVDGVVTQYPIYGTSGAVSIDYNIVQEANITGIGAPAEYDGVEGAVINLITRSGSNKFQAMGQFFYQDKNWNSRNVSVEELAPPAQKSYDYNGYLGGPIIKDRLWFFGSYRAGKREQEITNYDTPLMFKSRNVMFKLTSQLTKNSRLQAFLENEARKIENWYAGPLVAPEATWTIEEPGWVWNVSFFHVLSSSTHLEAKYFGYDINSQFYTAVGPDVAGRIDLATGEQTENASGSPDGYNKLHSVSLKLSHFLENFGGSHDFVLGFQYTHGNGADGFGYYANGDYFMDFMGQPYLKTNWKGYWGKLRNIQYGFFIQDSWVIGKRLSLNLGLRYNIYRGGGSPTSSRWLTDAPTVQEDYKTVYKTSSVAPRIGLTFDLLGDGKTALKAHYGWYYPLINSTYYKTLVEFNYDYVQSIYMGPAIGYVEFLRLNFGQDVSMDSNIDHPRQQEFTISIERELMKDLSFSITYINRSGRNYIFAVNTAGNYVKTQITDPYSGGTIDVWAQTNPGQDAYLYTNPTTSGQYDVVRIDPKRKYQSIGFKLNKRFSDKWMMMASYVYSAATYTADNTWGGSRGMIEYYFDPNHQINIEGNPTNDPTHMVKLQGTVVLPLEFYLSGNFTYISGTTYTRTLPVLLPQGLKDIFTEERGSRRLDPYISLDLRFEKQFIISDNFRLGVFGDVFNLFNRSVVTSINATAGANFEQPLGLSTPRGARLGIRLFFN